MNHRSTFNHSASAALIRLRPGHSKNGQGRVLGLEGDLWNVIAGQSVMREYKKADKTTGISLFVFHRKGERIGDIRKSWEPACKAANAEGKKFHDLRRTSIRNQVRAGVPERVAMAISDHKTRAVFDRYNIVSEQDLRNAVQRTQNYLRAIPDEAKKIAVMPESKPEAKGVAS